MRDHWAGLTESWRKQDDRVIENRTVRKRRITEARQEVLEVSDKRILSIFTAYMLDNNLLV